MNTSVNGNGPLRAAALIVALAGLAFWLYTFYAIAQLPAGDGSGMQWVAEMPLGMIFFIFVLPALLLARRGRLLWASLGLGLVGLVAFALLWRQLLTEFTT